MLPAQQSCCVVGTELRQGGRRDRHNFPAGISLFASRAGSLCGRTAAALATSPQPLHERGRASSSSSPSSDLPTIAISFIALFSTSLRAQLQACTARAEQVRTASSRASRSAAWSLPDPCPSATAVPGVWVHLHTGGVWLLASSLAGLSSGSHSPCCGSEVFLPAVRMGSGHTCWRCRFHRDARTRQEPAVGKQPPGKGYRAGDRDTVSA